MNTPFKNSTLDNDNISSRFWDRLKQNPMGLVFITYIIGFIIARIAVILSPNFQVWIVGLHLHHYNLGLIFILISVGIPLLLRDMRYERFTSILFGLGVGIVIDETGLLLTKGHDYWSWYTIPFFIGFGTLFFIASLTQNRSFKNKLMDSHRVSQTKNQHLGGLLHTPFFVSLVSYVMWFLIARGFTSLFPDYQLYWGNLHLQHFYLGIIFLFVCGIIYHYYRRPQQELLVASLYGGGLGLIIDQIAELFTEQDYWHPITYPFFAAFLIILILVTVYALIRERKLSQ